MPAIDATNIVRIEFQLLAHYSGAPLISVEEVAKNWFRLSPKKLLEKCYNGDIPLPITPMGDSQKAGKFIAVHDLAVYIDRQQQSAKAELEKLMS